MLIDLFIQASSQRIPPAADENGCRDPKPDIHREREGSCGKSPLKSSPQSSRNPVEEETEKLQEPEVMNDTRKIRPSESTKQSICKQAWRD